MSHEFDPGPVAEPFLSLAREYPGAEVFPAADFRIEWGPIFHRGRLDGSARVLVIGQDPGQHESIARRIMVGEAGMRVQGFLAKLGIDRSYAMVNAYLYSVYGQTAGEKHAADKKIAAYRHKWLDALTAGGQIEATITFGHLAKEAFVRWKKDSPAGAGGVVKHLTHPTMPEASAAGDPAKAAAASKKMLHDWNVALSALDGALGARDATRTLVPYGDAFQASERVPIPGFDLPVGSPSWWSSGEPWASREGATAEEKRATVEVVVPEGQRPW